ncbi:hypothetical protein SB48_HM08orf02655 [Heyndrickxia coagulans]|uniref:Uncharacterized protein n=1 Tax=Heyndrickxia coagulans TaxID=1398 RepID=A0AAN0WBY5_HEYCO|nr:hypothetical protein SB48_HM08orf02655 [Heyndrickxia coagulans]
MADIRKTDKQDLPADGEDKKGVLSSYRARLREGSKQKRGPSLT